MTDQEAKAFYNKTEWKNPVNGKRIKILKRDHFECQKCVERLKKAKESGIRLTGEDAKIRRAVQVHHIKELKDYPELGMDDDNLVSLCIQ